MTGDAIKVLALSDSSAPDGSSENVGQAETEALAEAASAQSAAEQGGASETIPICLGYEPVDTVEPGTLPGVEEGPTISEGSADDIFRNAPGHLADDVPANRVLIEGAVKPENYVRTGGGGEMLYREMLQNGTQVWAKVYDGQITNRGVNQVPLR